MSTTDSTLHLRGAGPEPESEERPRSRRWLFGFYAAVFLAFVIAAPGNMTFETKLGVATDPWKFLGDLGQLWSDGSGFGGIADQYVGYVFPMLPFYALADLLQIPVWLAERLWVSLVVAAAFWGALRLAERLRVGSPGTRLLGAAAYALWPTFTIIVGSTSAGALPGAVLPWVLLPLASVTLSARSAAVRSALAIPFMGGVNAASTLAALLPVGLYVLTRTGHRRTGLLTWWVPGVILATLWWVVPLLLLGSYGEDFMPYVEQAFNTTSTMSATEMLRGAGNWVAYLNFGEAWLPAGWMMATSVLAVLGSALAAALGLAGLARRDMPERRWLVLTVLVVSAIMLAGYGGALGAPFAEGFQAWLDGWLKPFRNIYKFQPGLALVLAFGLAHLLARGSSPHGTRPLPGRRFVPMLAAVLVLPALALPYLTGAVLQPGAFRELPEHWQQTADWLADNSSRSRALVVPATAHGVYTWGSPIDQPLHVLANSPWAQRDYVPFGTPGERRLLDAVEQALLTGGEVPGLADYLGRAGLHHVVVRNDLDPDQLGYVPPQIVKRTLEASGYRRVEAFGPLTTGGRIPPNTPVEIQGFYPRQRSVEIYEPDDSALPGRVALQPVANTAQVSGGPEALLQLSADADFRDRPAVLTGDEHPGLDTPPLRATADGLRRADTRFGLVNNNTSYTYTAKERNHTGSAQNAGEEPKQILPVEGTRHQTVATLRGAKSVTASSSGNWLFHLPGFDPVNAFDGDAGSAWAEGSSGDSVGEWIRIEFEKPTDIPGSLQLTPLASDGLRPAPTSVRIETDKGRVESALQAEATSQRVKAPQGEAKWLKLTITGSQEGRPGLTGAGFSEIEIPDVQVTRLLTLPNDAPDTETDAEVYSLHRTADPGGLAPVGAETGLHRKFRASSGGEHTLTATALPVPGRALDELLDQAAPGSRDRITASAESTSPTGTSLSARNLVDGDLTTAWIAGDRPVIHLKWPEKREISSMVLSGAGGISARPSEVQISSPDGAVTTSVDDNGWARFETMETDELTLTLTETAPRKLHNPLAGEDLQLPVGLNEIYLPALDEFRVAAPSADRTFELACGEGPPIAVNGTMHATKVSGSVRDLTERRPVDVELCAADEAEGTVELEAGDQIVEAGGAGPLAITDITLTRGDTSPQATGPERTVDASDWAGDARTVEVGEGQASYLRTHMNANRGWKATLDGEELESLRLDGWQQAFLIPEGSGGTVALEYTPATWYKGGMVAGLLGVVALVVLALLGRRSGTPLGEQQPPAPGWLLGGVALTAVMVVVSGPFALVVPVLALVAWWRPTLLPPIALAGMLGAGVVAALGATSAFADGVGAFGPLAQALALIALAASLVTVPVREESAAPQHAHRGAGRPVRQPPIADPAPAPAPGQYRQPETSRPPGEEANR
ncbi:alpha-(1-_3)-arabinofuranosyltransferase domain-containing protein [Streptomyces sparsus]